MDDRDNWGLATYFIVLIGMGYLSFKFLEVSSDIIVAIIGIMGSLIVAVFKYSSDRVREKEKEIERSKKENYQRLLHAVSEYAADNDKKGKLEVAYAESWAFADADVVEKTAEFLHKPSRSLFAQLLASMRVSLGMTPIRLSRDMMLELYPRGKKGMED